MPGVKLVFAVFAVGIAACTSMPVVKHKKYAFPKQVAFATADVKRPYEKLGAVRTKVEFPTLDPNHEPDALCKNYYNKAVRDLVKIAKKKGADAVIDIRSVVFLADGRVETYFTPECVDEGADGQVLVAGIAVKWKPVDPEHPEKSEPVVEMPPTPTAPMTQPSPQSSPKPLPIVLQPGAHLAEPIPADGSLTPDHFPATKSDE